MSPASNLDTRRLDVDDRGVATVTMDRPEGRTAFNDRLIGELTVVVTSLGEDPAVRVVVLNGAGEVFSAGADLNWMGSMKDWTEEENVADSRRMNWMLPASGTCPSR